MKSLATVLKINPIALGARASKLSIKQVEEVIDAIRYHHPYLNFHCKVSKSKGDKDLLTSLRDLGKDDFFTYEMDQWLLNGKCRIAVHSAKDLPEPLPKGLEVIAITEPIDSDDVIVFHPDIDINQLPLNLTIAASSYKRQENVRAQIPSSHIVDLRGTIDQRLQQVMEKKVDGAVIAKVALIRLGYLDLNMLKLEGQTTPLQGSLAVVAREGDLEIKKLFQVIDFRRGERSLYFGLSPHKYRSQGAVQHCPLIVPKPLPLQNFERLGYQIEEANYLLFTSQTSVQIFFEIATKLSLPISQLERMSLISVGQATAEALQKEGFYCSYIAQNESQEGLIELFQRIKWKKKPHILYLKSAKARPVLMEYLESSRLTFKAIELYDTQSYHPEAKPNLADFKEIVFTSPSTVNSFFELYESIPSHLRVVCKGKITYSYLEKINIPMKIL